MSIKRISRLRNCGIFRDFAWPDSLPEFGKFNLIYGWNGTGKTTISNLLRDLELRRVPATGEVALRINEQDVRGEEFPETNFSIKVFNRPFVNENIFSTSGADIPPIFVIGEESIEKQKEVERLKAQRTAALSNLASARTRKQDAERALDRFCIDRAKLIKETLRSSGPNPYNEYNKSHFRERAERMADDGDAAVYLLTDVDRDHLRAQHQSTPKSKVPEITYRLPTLQQLANSVSELLKTTVVSAAIKALKDDPKLAGWVHEGLELHKTRQSEICLFCEQLLPADRLATLEAHFSAEYEKFLDNLDKQNKDLENAAKAAAELPLPHRAELYEDMASEYDEVSQKLRAALESIREFLDSLVSKLADKRARPFDPLPFDISVPAVDENAIERLNEVIRKHNQACDEFETRVSNARDQLALDMIAREMEEFVGLENAVQQADTVVREWAQEVQRLTAEIERLEREIIEHRRPAEELNEDLCKYLGHCELKLVVKDTGYSIMRNGKPAEMLSEGEMTAIALLYFLKSLEDRDFDLQNGVVVLDDPVSSLDQNSLFGAFGYIRARTQNAAQVIILTHNFLFFQLVREWFRNLRGPDKRERRVFMLECVIDGVTRSAKLQAIDKLLMDFDSEYHYLFSRLYKMADEPPATSLEAYYWAPSIVRRVVETFLAFRVPNIGGHNRLWKQMDAIEFDTEKKSRIYRYMQTHSHRQAVGTPDEDLTLLGESQAVVRDVLEFMRAADADHVARMIAKVTNNNEESTIW